MLTKGQLVDRYRVHDLVGQGGMATVYRVRHIHLDTDRALKVMSLLHPSIQQRLLKEGKLQASLRHPNVVGVSDVLSVAGSPALLMEYIPGPSLDQWLHSYRPTVPEALAIFRQVVAGVAYAHKQGLVHRDLKPANILLLRQGDQIQVKVADFGLAKVVDDGLGGSGSTRTGVGMGTPAYMAPEQIRDAKHVDQRADIFALGCVLYELVCGRRAFPGEDLLDLLNAIVAGDYPAPQSINPELAQQVDATIAGCLLADRDTRLPTCADVLASLPPPQPQPQSWSVEALDAAESRHPEVSETPTLGQATGSSDDWTGKNAAVQPPTTGQPSSETWFPARAPAVGIESPSGTLIPGTMAELSTSASPPVSLAPLPSDTSSAWKIVALLAGAVAIAAVAIAAVAWTLASRQPQPVAPATTSTVAPATTSTAAPAVTPTVATPTVATPTVATPTVATPTVATPTVATLSATTPTAPRPQPANPAPAVVEVAPAPTGIVLVTGDAERVQLRGDSGSFPPGAVPVGTYQIIATFPGRDPAAAGQITVAKNREVKLRCTAAFVKCVQ